MIDVLILYEHKNREIESACLLAAELEERGYSVEILCIYSLKKYFVKSKVVVVPHLYDSEQLVLFCKNFWNHIPIVLDLQYEQVLRKNQRDGIHNPSGQAKDAFHIAWGMAQKNAYIEHGINEDRIAIVGHMGMDLLSDKYDELFYDKNYLAKKFDLDPNKTWLLFISTFAYKMKTQKELENYYRIDPSGIDGVKYSLKAQNVIINWLEQLAKEYPEIEVIYRRHPAELEDPDLLKMEMDIKNFHCINEYSMRQWVRIADLQYTWYSTSIADCYFRKRQCGIIRPYVLPEDYELDIMHGAKFIETYEELTKNIKSNSENEFPINDEIMEYYYGRTNKEKFRYAYENIADICEKMLNNPERFKVEYDFGHYNRWNITNAQEIKNIIKEYCSRILFELCTVVKFNIPLKFQDYGLAKRIILFNQEAYGIKKCIENYKKRYKNLNYCKEVK